MIFNKSEASEVSSEVFGLYSIKDELAGFTPPVICKDDARAKRWFKTELEQNLLMKNNPTDYSVWLIGYFNTKKGIIRALPENELAKIDWGVKHEK